MYLQTSCTSKRYGIFLSTTLSHAQSMFPFLQKAPVNDLNNPILLLFRHLVIGRQAQSSPENIGPNIHSRAFYVSICAASAVPLDCDKRVRAVYRLHMHGLPHYTCYACYIDNPSLFQNRQFLCDFCLFPAQFRCNMDFLQRYTGFLNVTHVTSVSFPSRAQHKERFSSLIERIFLPLG